ncbi:2,3-bisphosphoglycerate-independent phosphoglycerate mutase [Candidatus Roizmanbacteria bacterium]|nr:2,3-bisphosphoglycerate-independent phosphoglycerate mutase [Candidatus Roizmanbacteria bacterium]
MNNVLLVVLDGFGIAPSGPGNPVSLAHIPHIRSYLHNYPNTTLQASGEAVGLPKGEVGNTEVGHINLGAGRIVFQDLPRINNSIDDGSFYKIPAFIRSTEHVQQTGGAFHIIGLFSRGAVHSSLKHFYAVLELAQRQKIDKVFIHAITDGRDSSPIEGIEVLGEVERKLEQEGVGKIATVMGRYYGMDRDRRWERTEQAYKALTTGEGLHASSASEAIQTSYNAGVTDEFIKPTIILPDARIRPGDTVVFFNFRIDRPRQLTKAFVLDDFENQANITTSFDPYASQAYTKTVSTEPVLNAPFHRGEKIQNLCFVTMTEYEKNLPTVVAFAPTQVDVPLGEVLANHQISQLRMCETEKERFVTFYFNGQHENAYPLEERIILPSPKVPTYDLKPEMAAYEITDVLLQKMSENKYRFILVNFANADMVGHTGSIPASIKAVETLDVCLDKIVKLAAEKNYTVLVTADHGNVEVKINPKTGGASTEHTGNLVPFIVIRPDLKGKTDGVISGVLGDVAPTILKLLEIPQPPQMKGKNLKVM